MGLYDTLVVVDYPLPDGIKRPDFQTKDLNCWLDHFELRADGTLWIQQYEIEDQSDPNAVGWARFAGSLAHVNKRWERYHHTGTINFYDWDKESKQMIEFVGHFRDGKVFRIERLR